MRLYRAMAGEIREKTCFKLGYELHQIICYRPGLNFEHSMLAVAARAIRRRCSMSLTWLDALYHSGVDAPGFLQTSKNSPGRSGPSEYASTICFHLSSSSPSTGCSWTTATCMGVREVEVTYAKYGIDEHEGAIVVVWPDGCIGIATSQ